MIDTDQTGNKKLIALVLQLDWDGWTDWEHDFIPRLERSQYENLSYKMKTIVGNLYDKWEGRS